MGKVKSLNQLNARENQNVKTSGKGANVTKQKAQENLVRAGEVKSRNQLVSGTGKVRNKAHDGDE